MPIPFIQAKNYTKTPSKARVIDLVVIHDMESNEEPDTAEQVAAWFASKNAPAASAHYCVDSNSAVQCVHDYDVAWHAPGANHHGIGIEHAGRARQTDAEWRDPYSTSMLEISGLLTAELVKEYKLPNKFVTAAELVKGGRGITTHWECSKAWRLSDHTDPGKYFPLTYFLEIVQSHLDGGHVPDDPRIAVNAPTVDILTHISWPTGSYVVVTSDGGTFPFGGAPFIGSLGDVKLNRPIKAVTLTPTGQGLLFLSDDGVFAKGDAQFKGAIDVQGD